jgi:hypothetical protein
MSPSSGMGAVGIVSAIEAVRDGHRVTVIEALGFEPEAAGRLSKTPPAAPRISGWGATGSPQHTGDSHRPRSRSAAVICRSFCTYRKCALLRKTPSLCQPYASNQRPSCLAEDQGRNDLCGEFWLVSACLTVQFKGVLKGHHSSLRNRRAHGGQEVPTLPTINGAAQRLAAARPLGKGTTPRLWFICPHSAVPRVHSECDMAKRRLRLRSARQRVLREREAAEWRGLGRACSSVEAISIRTLTTTAPSVRPRSRWTGQS